MPHRVSWTIPMTGLLAWGEIIYGGGGFVKDSTLRFVHALPVEAPRRFDLTQPWFPRSGEYFDVHISPKSSHISWLRTACSFHHHRNRHCKAEFWWLLRSWGPLTCRRTHTERFSRKAKGGVRMRKRGDRDRCAYWSRASIVPDGSSYSSCADLAGG